MKEHNRLPFFGLGFVVPYWKQYRGLAVAMVLCGLLGSVTDAMFPLFQRYAVNHFVGGKTLDTMGIFFAAYLVTLLLRALLNGSSAYLTNKMEVSLDFSIRRDVFAHLQELSLSYYNQNGVGYIHARVISDVDRIGGLCSWMLMNLIWEGSYLLYIIVIMLTICPPLGALLLLLMPIEAVFCFYFQHRLTRLGRQVREANSKVTADYNEGITGARTIKTLVAEREMERRFDADAGEMYRTSVHMGRYRGGLRAVIDLTANLGLALILWRGGGMALNGALAIGTLSAFTVYAINMTGSVQEVAEVLESLINAQVNIERVHTLLSQQPDVVDTPEVIARYGTSLQPKRENWEPLWGDVEFRDVTFHYPDGEEIILSHFDLKVPQGASVAIVGETGAGKSTLVNLVCRFFEPTEGAVLIDGRDARERSQLWLHSSIGYVLQTPHLFSGTVLENLRYGNPEATMEEIELACRRVCADQVIARMEHGYDSQVGEGGEMLSTGEKQLLSFARAILSDPRILILDEATSSVDTLTEQIIQQAISEVTRGRTSFIIAHRLSTIRGADTILMVKDGQIVERGRHSELMKRRGAYFRLYMRQFERETADRLLDKE